jgi:phosphohistidine phosphatase
MPLILVRHAKALSRKKARLQDVADPERALTVKGRAAFLIHLQNNAELFKGTQLFVCSSYLRAKQTLEILTFFLHAEKVSQKVLPEITPEDAVESFAKWLEGRNERKIVVVGHEPFISNFLIHATAGKWSPQKIKKGDIVVVSERGRGLKIEIISVEVN